MLWGQAGGGGRRWWCKIGGKPVSLRVEERIRRSAFVGMWVKTSKSKKCCAWSNFQEDSLIPPGRGVVLFPVVRVHHPLWSYVIVEYFRFTGASGVCLIPGAGGPAAGGGSGAQLELVGSISSLELRRGWVVVWVERGWWCPNAGWFGLVQLCALTFEVGFEGVNADEDFIDGPLTKYEEVVLRLVEPDGSFARRRRRLIT
eukprot:scaffold16305_cov124-Isochrysis_galbana.AAC.13